MMAEFPALPVWTDAYLADTTHLTTEEHGAYLLMLMAAWRSRECRLPDDDRYLAKVCRCSERVWRRLRVTLEPFWQVEGGWWTQKRLARERKYLDAVRAKRRAAAEAKHRKDNETTDAHAGAHALQPTPTPTDSKKEAPIGASKESSPQAAPPAPPDPPPKPKREAHGTRLPPDWQPTPDLIEYARKEGLTDDQLQRELERFRNHWLGASGQRARKSDWAACWRNWILRAADDARRFAGRRGGNGGGGSGNRGADRPRGLVANTLAVLHRRGQVAGHVH